MRTMQAALLFAAAVSCSGIAAAGSTAKATDDPNKTTAPVAQPETDPAMSHSGAVVPGQPIRPEGTQEAAVPKTPKDKEAAGSSDIGAGKMNDKAQRPSSGADSAPPPP